MTARENELLKRLEKRMNWLNARIYKLADSREDLSFDRAEAHALEWGISVIEKYLGVGKEVENICNHTWAKWDDKKVFCVKCLEFVSPDLLNEGGKE
jgi:hypothetical protein